MLARLAASAEDEQSADSEAAIEKYLRSVLAVENILTLDRLRQVQLRFTFLCWSFTLFPSAACPPASPSNPE